VLVGTVAVGLSHFATAKDVSEKFVEQDKKMIAASQDVEKKFASVQSAITKSSLETRQQRIQDELFRLRSDTQQKGTMPQIQRFEAELLDVSARLRQLDERRP